MLRTRLHGRGGQGIKTASQTLGTARHTWPDIRPRISNGSAPCGFGQAREPIDAAMGRNANV
jgi:hypothetical protein